MIAVTAKRLLPADRDFLKVVENICRLRPRMIILREKELSGEEYKSLFESCLPICRRSGIMLSAHSHPDILDELGAEAVQLPLSLFKDRRLRLPSGIQKGVSVHSAAEAVQAESLGADWLIAGHIYDTACKSGLPGRGLAFLREVTSAVSIPVYAIGGIETAARQKAVREAGAADHCLMSSLMK